MAIRRSIHSLVLMLACFALVVLTFSASPARAALSATLTFTSTSASANAHPDVTAAMEFPGAPDVKDLSLALPAGMRIAPAAVASPCSLAAAAAGACPSSAKIGTVSVTALGGVSGSGDIFMTASPSAQQPAGIAADITLASGQGDVVMTGAIELNLNGVAAAGGAQTAEERQRVTFADVPAASSTSAAFHMTGLTLLFDGDAGGASPLITNSSACPTTAASASLSATAYDSSAATAVTAYPVTNCAAVPANPVFGAALSSPIAGSLTNESFTIDFLPGDGAARSPQFRMGPALTLWNSAWGAAADMCPTASLGVNPSQATFDPAGCPDQARAGTVTVNTPLLSTPLSGDMWFVEKAGYPVVGLDLSGNGARVRSTATFAEVQVDPACDVIFEICTTEFALAPRLPMLPATRWQFNFGAANRVSSTGQPLTDRMFKIQNFAHPLCATPNQTRLKLLSYSNSALIEQSEPLGIYGCLNSGNPPDTEFTANLSSPTNDSTPTFDFAALPSATSFQCRVDSGAWGTCSSPWTAPALPDGAHTVYVRAINEAGADASPVSKTFVVDVTPPAPPTISSPTEGQVIQAVSTSIVFSGEASGTYSCRIDGGAFAACSSPHDTGTLADGNHVFEVRQSDQAGNTSVERVRNFVTDPTLSAAFSLVATTTQANAHPDLVATADFPGNPDVTSLTYSFPPGLRIAPAAVATPCSLADAAAGSCAVSSKIGTVSLTALGGVTGAGDLYMTDPPPGEFVAGIALEANLSGGLGSFVAQGGLDLKLNGQSFPSTGPQANESRQRISLTALPTESSLGAPMAVTQLRLTLDGSTGGSSQPLITNPSQCPTQSVTAAVVATGSDSGTATGVSAYPVAGCGSIDSGYVMSSALSDPVAGAQTGVKLSVSPSIGSSPIRAMQFRFGSSMGTNYPSVGSSEDQCPVESAGPQSVFAGASTCPTQAIVGQVTLESPMFASRKYGSIRIIEGGLLVPNFAIDIPVGEGGYVRFRSSDATVHVDPACDPLFDICQQEILLTVPVPSIPGAIWKFNFDGPDRIDTAGNSLPGRVFKVADASDDACNSPNEFRATVAPYSGTPAVQGSSSNSISGCLF